MLPGSTFEELGNSPLRVKTNIKTMGVGSRRDEENAVEKLQGELTAFY